MLPLARGLIIFGLSLTLIGGLIYVVARLGVPLGRLPGDIRIQGENLTCVFPLATSIILSILLTVILNIAIRFINK